MVASSYPTTFTGSSTMQLAQSRLQYSCCRPRRCAAAHDLRRPACVIGQSSAEAEVYRQRTTDGKACESSTQNGSVTGMPGRNGLDSGGNWRDHAYALRRVSSRSTSTSSNGTAIQPFCSNQQKNIRSKSKHGKGKRAGRRGPRRKDFKDPMRDLANEVLALPEVNFDVKLAEVLEGVVTDPRELTQLLSALGRKKDAVRSVRVFEWAQTSGIPVNAIHYSKLISSWGARGKWREAEAVFESLADNCPGTPDVAAHNALLKAYVRGGRRDLAEALFAEMR
eukprot:CAMPEP_0118926728 /NCGR_PEP_ID=MMETSP1169-20130426/4355_1 /TAXON_ID=36882 /ORGANISM="Pyramimonas obovata, Strain CCMP722" /LENGTH=279 /DNA_ID=CAMNT_0006868343 /DNA_START=351 /DNA_END=1187 /DNA_ORIENTATION=-